MSFNTTVPLLMAVPPQKTVNLNYVPCISFFSPSMLPMITSSQPSLMVRAGSGFMLNFPSSLIATTEQPVSSLIFDSASFFTTRDLGARGHWKPLAFQPGTSLNPPHREKGQGCRIRKAASATFTPSIEIIHPHNGCHQSHHGKYEINKRCRGRLLFIEVRKAFWCPKCARPRAVGGESLGGAPF